MNAQLHPALAAALLPFAPPQSVVHKIVAATLPPLPDVDPKVLRSEAQAIRLEQALPECLRGLVC